MADGELRTYERAAAGGDPDATRSLKHARCRVGVCCAHELDAPELPHAMPPIPEAARSCRAWLNGIGRRDSLSFMPGGDDRLDITIRLVGDPDTLTAAREWFQRTFPDRPTQDFDALRPLGRSFYGPRSNFQPVVKLIEVGCRDCYPLSPDAPRVRVKDCERCGGTGIVLYRADRLPAPQEPTPEPSAQYTTCFTCWAGETADQNLCLICDGTGRVFVTS